MHHFVHNLVQLNDTSIFRDLISSVDPLTEGCFLLCESLFARHTSEVMTLAQPSVFEVLK